MAHVWFTTFAEGVRVGIEVARHASDKAAFIDTNLLEGVDCCSGDVENVLVINHVGTRVTKVMKSVQEVIFPTVSEAFSLFMMESASRNPPTDSDELNHFALASQS